MPNWCECDLYVRGNKSELNKFKKFAEDKESVLSTEKFVPYPEKFKEMDKKRDEVDKKRQSFQESLVKSGKPENAAREEAWTKYPSMTDGFNSGGYDWCINNWGTKWGICHAELIEQSDDELMYTFDCAWSPCNPVILAMAKQFPALEFDLRYFEQGCGFNGIFLCNKGRVEKDVSGDYFGDRGG